MKEFICVCLTVFLITGLCGCGQGKAEQTSIQNTATEATTLHTEAEEFEYAVTQRIHESLPEFTFTLHGQHNNRFPEDHWITINAIEISGEGYHQRLDGFETDGPFYPENDTCLQIADFNDDGYLDIRLLKWMGGSLGNMPSLFWLWDNNKQCFVANKQLEELSESSGIMVRDQRLVSSYNMKGDKWGHSISYYTYENKKFVKAEETQNYCAYEDDVFFMFEEIYKREDGEMRLVSKTKEKVENQ